MKFPTGDFVFNTFQLLHYNRTGTLLTKKQLYSMEKHYNSNWCPKAIHENTYASIVVPDWKISKLHPETKEDDVVDLDYAMICAYLLVTLEIYK